MCPRVELILQIIIILLIIFLGFIKSKPSLLIANNKNEEKILFPAEWITRVVNLPQSGETTTAERDDLHCKSLFLVKNKGQWIAKSGPKAAYGNFAMRTQFSGRLDSK